MFTLTILFTIIMFCQTNKNFLIVKDTYINIQSQRFNAIIIKNNEKEKKRTKIVFESLIKFFFCFNI